MDAVQGVSLPRSGHNLLVGHLQKYFVGNAVCPDYRHTLLPFLAKSKTRRESLSNDQEKLFHYCEYYYSCRSYPCCNANNSFQKSHDFELDLSADPATKYLIQTRDRMGLLISWFEMRLKKNRERDSRQGFEAFVQRNRQYVDGFHRKWLDSRLPNCLRLDYDDYLHRPAELLADAILFFDADHILDYSRITQIVADVQPARVNSAFRYFDESMQSAIP